MTINRHRWECVSAGMYDDLYRCNRCGQHFMTQADNPSKLSPPMRGCIAAGDDVMSLNFEGALTWMKEGEAVLRKGWNGKNMFLFLVPDPIISMSLGDRPMTVLSLPFIMMKTADDKLVPWLASQTDMLATDWETMSGARFANALDKMQYGD